MAQCKDCIHGEVCDIFVHTRTLICNDKADRMCKMFKSTADVAPKSEVAKLLDEIIDYLSYSDDDVIFESKYRTIDLDEVANKFDELKKKYTEGNNG